MNKCIICSKYPICISKGNQCCVEDYYLRQLDVLNNLYSIECLRVANIVYIAQCSPNFLVAKKAFKYLCSNTTFFKVPKKSRGNERDKVIIFIEESRYEKIGISCLDLVKSNLAYFELANIAIYARKEAISLYAFDYAVSNNLLDNGTLKEIYDWSGHPNIKKLALNKMQYNSCLTD